MNTKVIVVLVGLVVAVGVSFSVASPRDAMDDSGDGMNKDIDLSGVCFTQPEEEEPCNEK